MPEVPLPGVPGAIVSAAIFFGGKVFQNRKFRDVPPATAEERDRRVASLEALIRDPRSPLHGVSRVGSFARQKIALLEALQYPALLPVVGVPVESLAPGGAPTPRTYPAEGPVSMGRANRYAVLASILIALGQKAWEAWGPHKEKDPWKKLRADRAARMRSQKASAHRRRKRTSGQTKSAGGKVSPRTSPGGSPIPQALPMPPTNEPIAGQVKVVKERDAALAKVPQMSRQKECDLFGTNCPPAPLPAPPAGPTTAQKIGQELRYALERLAEDRLNRILNPKPKSQVVASPITPPQLGSIVLPSQDFAPLRQLERLRLPGSRVPGTRTDTKNCECPPKKKCKPGMRKVKKVTSRKVHGLNITQTYHWVNKMRTCKGSRSTARA